ncbi:Beta-TrCP [Arthrobotrys entomopaga]|nr:Beta-TrCP [Arthrobotrys entomopaga]
MHLASVSSDKKIFLWDAKTGEFVTQIDDGDKNHVGSIYSISWHSDSKRFVTASGDRTVKIWDVEAQKNTQTWSFGDAGSVSDQQVGVVWPKRADDLIISISNSGDLNYLSEKSDKPMRIVSGHQKSITSLGIDDAGKTLWTGSYDGKVCSWDAATGVAEVPESQTHSNQVTGFAASEKRMYSIGMDDTLRTIDNSVKDFVGSLASTQGQPRGIAFAPDRSKPDQSTLFVATLQEICVYVDGKKTTSTPIKDYTPTSVAYSASAGVLAVGAQNNNVYLYQLSKSDDQIPASPTSVLKSSQSSISALAFAPNAPLLAAGDSSGKIFLYDVTTGETKTNRWAFHTARVTSIAWNKAGTHIVSAGLNTNVIIYSAVEYHKNIKALGAHKEGCNGAVWIDEKTVATAGSDGCVKIWAVTL